MADLKEYMTIPQVAAILKRDQATVNRYIKRGYLKAEQIAGRFLIEKSQLQNFIYPTPGNPLWKSKKAQKQI